MPNRSGKERHPLEPKPPRKLKPPREQREATPLQTQHKPAPESSMGDDEDTPAWAKELLTQFGKMNTSIEAIKKDLKGLGARVRNAETRIQAVEDTQASQQTELTDIKKRLTKAESKVTYQGMQMRRSNLVLVGLSEGLLEEDADDELADILRYILDRGGLEEAPEVERHHRALRPRPGPEESPRPYILKLLRYRDRERIRKAAIAKSEKLAEDGKKLEWRGEPFCVFQDLPPEILDARREYAEIKKKLYKAKLRHGHLIKNGKVRLIVTIKDVKHIYNTPNEALQNLRRELPSVFG